MIPGDNVTNLCQGLHFLAPPPVLVPPPIPTNRLCQVVLTIQFYWVPSKLFHILNQSASQLSSYSVPKIQKMEHSIWGKWISLLFFGKMVIREHSKLFQIQDCEELRVAVSHGSS
jgi:hypothetical protein